MDIQDPVDKPADETQGDKPEPKKDDTLSKDNDVVKLFKSRAEASRRFRDNLKQGEWKKNVELRIGHPVSGYDASGTVVQDESDMQSEINPDWSLTKTKTANLFSQVPAVQMTHENKQYAGAIPAFAKSVNYELSEKRTNISAAMEEVLNDVVNASGIGAILTEYVARFEPVEMLMPRTINTPNGPVDVNKLPQRVVQELMARKVVSIQESQRVVSYKFAQTRLSPSSLLWALEFKGSAFDDSDWTGYDDQCSWADGMHEFGLKADQKEAVCGASEKEQLGLNQETTDAGAFGDLKKVSFTRIFYWRHRVDPEELHLDSIWELVLVKGLENPVRHEQYRGQRLVEQTRKYVGVRRFPLQFLTLTYITDNPVPPSDSAAGRPQVNDMRRSRSQIFQNRQHSFPMRWFDVNRVPITVQNQLMNGNLQGFLPTNGPGDKAFGEIARASYPSEDMAFDNITKTDLMEAWQLGPDQMGGGRGAKTKGEAQLQQTNFATRIGLERAKVAAFFLRNVDVLAGLMTLFSDFPNLTEQEKQQMMKVWDSKQITHDLVLKVRPDSTIVLDSEQRIQRIMRFMNMTVQSGYVNPKPLIFEFAELSGIDPSDVIVDPKPKQPEDPNISFRFTGKQDLMNPVVAGMLMDRGQFPKPETLDAAKKALLNAQEPPAPPQQGQPGSQQPEAPPVETGEDNPHMTLAPKIAKRSQDLKG
jgi:hypothetical protein